MRVEAIGVVDLSDTAMQQNIVGSNEWRGARGFRRRGTKGRRHSTAQYKDLEEND